MDKKLRSSSNISLDSLEMESKTRTIKQKASDENVDTILVPFYENDVLIKVPKGRKKVRQTGHKSIKKDIVTGDIQQYKNYLMNKNLQKDKKTSYLEIFRKQFGSNCNEIQKKDPNEIRSISPEFGDTERESIGEECNNTLVSEFYNTESYNEIYYEKLLNQEFEQYLDQSFEEALRFNDEIRSKTSEDMNDNNLRSISEVSRPHRHIRRTTVPFNENIRLGGLGPDLENIRPRLERAKSLQRYSEKVRMENRLKIYKKSIEADNGKKAERESSANRCVSNQIKCKDQKAKKKSSYLINRTTQEKTSVTKNICNSKSKSADVKNLKGRELLETNKTNDRNSKENLEIKKNRVINRKLLSAKDSLQKYIKTNYETARVKSSVRSQGINTDEKQNNDISPVQISFLVNVGGIRPSSALKSLEEKHRQYQEKVKDFTMDHNNV